MTDIPDVSGYMLKDAKPLLKKAGIDIKGVSITSVPRVKYAAYDEDFRVLRFERTFDDSVELLVCPGKGDLCPDERTV
jgi:hypothetical protein